MRRKVLISVRGIYQQRFFFHQVDGGLDFPRQFPVDHWGVGERIEQNIWGVRGRSPHENFRVFLIILIRKVIKRYMIHSPLITDHFCSETSKICQRLGVGPQESLRCKYGKGISQKSDNIYSQKS